MRPAYATWRAGTTNRLSCRATMLNRLEESIPWNRFMGSLVLKRLQILASLAKARKEVTSFDDFCEIVDE